jgi:hypothetical protein
VALLVGLVVRGGAAFVVDHGRDEDRKADAEATGTDGAPEPTSPALAKLLGVCADDPEPIAEAATYVAGPKPHYIEMVVLKDLGDGFEDDDHWPGITGGAYYRSLDDVDFADVELVACLNITDSTYVSDCQMSTYGSSSEVVDEEFYAGSGRMEVREAKTGKVIKTIDVPATKGLSCPDFGSTGSHLLDVPYEKADELLRATLQASRRPE